MKIAAILEGSVVNGGGFSQALNAVLQMASISNGKFEFVVFTSILENIDYLKRLEIVAKPFKPSLKEKFITVCALNVVGRWMQRKLNLVGKFEKNLLKEKVDLVYFVEPSMLAISLQKLNYITTVWDICHRDSPEFPEVRVCNEFYERELFYKNCLAPALAVLTDSVILSERISRRYGIDFDCMIAMPFAPAPFMTEQHAECHKGVLQKYNLNKGYYFYPAQFWAHKNHVRILEAMSILNEQSVPCQVVFSGGDQGTREHVANIVETLGLDEQVRFLGFVPVEDVKGLYDGCLAVVMPSYFGPTNLPPLEAWSIGKPLIYSKHFSEQAGDAALLVDPDDAQSIAKAMKEIMTPHIAERLVKRGHERLHEIANQREHAEVELVKRLTQFEVRRRTWF